MYSKQQFCNLLSRIASLAMEIVLALAAVPALAQNTVPPTARQAAADPAFAARLARQVPAHPATKSQAQIRSRRASPQDQILYDNGPYNGTTDAWTINFGFSTSESFTGGGPVTGLHFVYWDASTSDLLTTVDISIGSTSFGGTPQTLTGVTNTFLGMNQYGYALYQADYSFSGGSGSYITLSNACTTSGCSVSNPIYWDENSGVGCTSQGCPSTAYESTIDSIPSEAFSLDGGPPPPPPPLPCFEPGGNLQVIHDFTGQEGGGGPGPSGLTIDTAGNVYGTTPGGGDYGRGLVYKMSPKGQDWLFTHLYSFTGDYNGSGPAGVVLGAGGAVYGTADGGIQNCGYNGGSYCGLVYRVSLSPSACPTALCSWTETVLYRFTGDPDAWRPTGYLVFDQAGNLYGTTSSGGAYGQGAVYELTPSKGGWTKKVIYSFTGGSDGWNPSSVLVGRDGNLYGIAGNVVFQLAPSGNGWAETVLYTFQNTQGDGALPQDLVQNGSGNLYGISTWFYQLDPYGDYRKAAIEFELSPSSGNWVFTELLFVQHDPVWYNDLFNSLAIDTAGNTYIAGTTIVYDGICDTYLHCYYYIDGRLGANYVDEEFSAYGLAPDAQGNHLYGVTPDCGRYGNGTVWQISP